MPTWAWVLVGVSVGASLFMAAMSRVAAKADREAREALRRRVLAAHGQRRVGGS